MERKAVNQEKAKSRANGQEEHSLSQEVFDIQSHVSNVAGSASSNLVNPPSATFKVSADTVQRKEDHAIPRDVQMKMQKSFGEDFSDVSIHQNSPEPEKLNARAFAQGNDIHFAPGQFNVHSLKGQELLGHELAHVQQQRQGRVVPSVQSKALEINSDHRLEEEAESLGVKAASETEPAEKRVVQTTNTTLSGKSPIQRARTFPYVAIAGSPGQSIGDIPLETDSECISIPEGSRIEVLAASGSKLRVRYVDPSGAEYIGEIDATHVDDPTVRQFDTDLSGRKSTWVPSGPGSGNTFERWASAATESAAPDITTVTTINCWEMVLMAAFRAGMINWQWIHDLYVSNAGDRAAWYAALPARLTAGGTRTYDQTARTPQPTRGDLVFFDGASHVSMATGNGDEIYTFWPPPNTAFTRGGTVDAVKTSTIHELSDYMDLHMGGRPVVTIGTPAW